MRVCSELIGDEAQMVECQVMPTAYFNEHITYLVKGGLVSTRTILKAISGLLKPLVIFDCKCEWSRVQISPPLT